MSDRPAPASCAVCGADLPRNARACPECGADERTGWRESDPSDGLDLPDENFDRERFAEAELGQHPRRTGRVLFWWLTAIGVLIMVVVLVVLKRFWGAP
jgi:predicted nucleic acid-binding Zn ribbon protein